MKTFIITCNVINGDTEFLQHYGLDAESQPAAMEKAEERAKAENEGKLAEYEGSNETGIFMLTDHYTQRLEIVSAIEVTVEEYATLIKFCII